MRNWLLLTVQLAVALCAAPALAQNAALERKPIEVGAPIGDEHRPVQTLDHSPLARAGLDAVKLDAATLRLAGYTTKTGAGLYLIRESPELATMAENMLPKGLPVAKVVEFLKSNPRATAAVVGVTAAGFTLTAVTEYTTPESFLRRNRYWISLLTGVFAAVVAWVVYARRK